MGGAPKGARERKALARHEDLLIEERRLFASGKTRVAGLDEAGAGPWAGPVVAACVVLESGAPTDAMLGVDDSKKLSPEKRAELADKIRSSALAWAVAEASVEEIDRINIRAAGILAMRRAFEACLARVGSVDHLLIDAREIPGVAVAQTSLIKGDARCLSIAAASILAKVTRDRAMVEAAARFPHHGFDRHKGYGTSDHRAAIDAHGVTPLHRRSFEPIRTLVGWTPPEPELPAPALDGAPSAPSGRGAKGGAPSAGDRKSRAGAKSTAQLGLFAPARRPK